MSNMLAYFESQKEAMVNTLTEMVKHETFTREKVMVDKFGNWVENQLKDLGASVTRYPQDEVGDFLLAKWNDGAPGKPILFLVHIDTVFPSGTLKTQPIRISSEGRLYGPGAIDMKGGITIALTAIRGLRELNQFPNRPIHLLMTTEEEIGSIQSEPLIKECAEGCSLVLVMEPATKEGALKTWRKGGGKYELIVEGRASHAGNAPEEGVNAIIEFAQQAIKINEMNDLKNGTSVSVTMVDGGSAGNVIPAHVSAHIDTRFLTVEAMENLREKMNKLYPHIPGAKVEVVRHGSRPPMERMPGVFEQAEAIGKKYGVTIYEDGSGGGSDGNFTAAMGIPTLDGLGPQGEGLHAIHEHVIINTLPKRATLVAGLLMDWQDM